MIFRIFELECWLCLSPLRSKHLEKNFALSDWKSLYLSLNWRRELGLLSVCGRGHCNNITSEREYFLEKYRNMVPALCVVSDVKINQWSFVVVSKRKACTERKLLNTYVFSIIVVGIFLTFRIKQFFLLFLYETPPLHVKWGTGAALTWLAVRSNINISPIPQSQSAQLVLHDSITQQFVVKCLK